MNHMLHRVHYSTLHSSQPRKKKAVKTVESSKVPLKSLALF
jgi:hypothetical protein